MPDLLSCPVADLLARSRAAGLSVQTGEGRLRIRGPQGAENLGRALLARKEEVLSILEKAEASAAKWSARLRQALALSGLTDVQRTILEGRLEIIQNYLQQREPLLLDQDNMQLWIEGTLARWGLAEALPPATEPQSHAAELEDPRSRLSPAGRASGAVMRSWGLPRYYPGAG
jgi:hypothetical protein